MHIDGPRRRADSFPNSAASIRSRTFDFSRASRSPRSSLTLPGSPLFPMTRTSSTESSPLTLITKETAVARDPAGSTNTTRPPTPVSPPLEKLAVISPIALRKQEAGIITTNNGETTKEPQPVTAIPEPEEIATISDDVRSEMSSHPPVKAWKPVSPAVLCSPVISDSNDIVVDMTARQETGRYAAGAPTPSAKTNEQGATALSSIENQVLSTRISDVQPLPVLEAKENANPTTTASTNGPNADASDCINNMAKETNPAPTRCQGVCLHHSYERLCITASSCILGELGELYLTNGYTIDSR
ncbi:MAG: hypothetical protein J3Q66DRAFT_163167 [Benniella sp.]|nr:MAG: hypothetical protein J3Q66DRAFT_163167 [Benniella sp.]